MSEMVNFWVDFDKFLAQVAPKMRSSLRPPASEAQVQAVEAKLNVRLPQDLREAYLCHNGQDKSALAGSIIGALDHWVSLDELVISWQQTNEINESLKAQWAADDFSDEPDETIDDSTWLVRPDWWHPGWLPIAQGITDAAWCVDMAPGKAGVVGQILAWDSVDSASNELVASSFAALLSRIFSLVKSGQVIYEDREGWVEAATKRNFDPRWSCRSR
jgi:cell wall assembly regulator SMI1